MNNGNTNNPNGQNDNSTSGANGNGENDNQPQNPNQNQNRNSNEGSNEETTPRQQPVRPPQTPPGADMQTLDTENWRFRDEDPRLSMNQERDPNRRIPQWERAGLRHGHEVYRASLQACKIKVKGHRGPSSFTAINRAAANAYESIRSNIEQMPRNVGNGTVNSRGRVGASPAQRRRVMEQDQEQNVSRDAAQASMNDGQNVGQMGMEERPRPNLLPSPIGEDMGLGGGAAGVREGSGRFDPAFRSGAEPSSGINIRQGYSGMNAPALMEMECWTSRLWTM
ncbi:hypothetical protein B0J14DRAFT_635740 [Halenospora varia]|nr:hypothetical protein B0J14DRAFT_635740 [Halenospora varia]